MSDQNDPLPLLSEEVLIEDEMRTLVKDIAYYGVSLRFEPDAGGYTIHAKGAAEAAVRYLSPKQAVAALRLVLTAAMSADTNP